MILSALSTLAAVGCAGSEPEAKTDDDNNFSSNQATLLDMEFDSTLTTDFSWNEKQTIQAQLLYTIGHLNFDNSVGRLDALELSNVKSTTDESTGKVTIAYHAKLPVAWGSKTNLPKSYDFRLPRDVSESAQEKFTESYKGACVDHGAHDLDSGSMWYYYRPQNAGCTINDADALKTTAKVTVSKLNTKAKYPEYHEIWKDNRLEVVTIFGKYEVGGADFDAGVRGFNQFVSSVKRTMGPSATVTTASPVDVTMETTLPDGKVVKITALLVDAITSVWEGFDERYENLTESADVIAYNGHAGLGQNVRALAKKGRWAKEKYQIFFMNGCDTFAYVDGALAQTRSTLNRNDPSGTKYMEFVTNAMPSFFSSMPAASSALITGLLDYKSPKTYEDIFKGIDRAEVVLVTGEEDNVFKPGMKIGK
ncbi:MAG: hypothetical protein U0270_26350 [Labilithrix sp.]